MLRIDRHSLDMSLIQRIPVATLPTSASQLLYGILGVIQLLRGPYLIGITQRQFVGKIGEASVFRVTEVVFVPFRPTPLAEKLRRREALHLKILAQFLEDGDFFFSYNFDLSTSMQGKLDRALDTSRSKTERFLHQQFDKRFYWNCALQSKLVDACNRQHTDWGRTSVARFILPVLRGFFTTFFQLFRGYCCQFFLISRRSRHYAGTRYQTRGVTEEGHVANFVETEQFCNFRGAWTSFVQLRGSIPLYWVQRAGYKLKPKPNMSNLPTEEQRAAFETHFRSVTNRYGNVMIVNLLDQKGDEAQLCEAYETYWRNAKLPGTYHAFDFHAYCRNNQFSNVSILLDNTYQDQAALNYLHIASDGRVLSRQSGVIRTNCLDCLDRTNLVMSVFANRSLHEQLVSFDISPLEGYASRPLDHLFKRSWADNGDAISHQYAGTGALKSDFTRTGKRKTKGVVRDGINSLSRYVINNFRDGLRQAAIDLFLNTKQVDTLELNLEDDEDDEGMLWGEDVTEAMEQSIECLFSSCRRDEPETVLGGWLVISINKRDHEQQRIVILTDRSWNRVKYNFRKQRVIHIKRKELSNIRGVTIGPLQRRKKDKHHKKQQEFFGFRLEGDSVANATRPHKEHQLYRMVLPPDSEAGFAKEMVLEIVDALVNAHRELHNRSSVATLSTSVSTASEALNWKVSAASSAAASSSPTTGTLLPSAESVKVREKMFVREAPLTRSTGQGLVTALTRLKPKSTKARLRSRHGSGPFTFGSPATMAPSPLQEVYQSTEQSSDDL